MARMILPGGTTDYKYRADGMRVRKEIPGLVEKDYYDGQMPVETFEDFSTGNDKLTRNFVGARGIEMMETTTGGSTTQVYPLYDTHGNMVATLSKNTAGTSWSLGNERSYDVWGSVRSGAATGGPKGRYVANLGHVADDESGLIYMRARYYEPESGRFVSEDIAKYGENWFAYCSSKPTNYHDFSGRSETAIGVGVANSLGEASETSYGGYIITWQFNVVRDRILYFGADWLTKWGGTSASISAYVRAMEEYAKGKGCNSINFSWSTTTPGGQAFIDKLIQELGSTRGLQDANRILWLIEAMN